MNWLKISTAAIIFLSVSAFAQTQKKEWTLLVFVNGHNNLSRFAEMNIKDMEKIGSTDDMNIVVEWGSASTNVTKRLYVEKSTDPTKVTSRSLVNLVDYDMGDYKNLQSFVRWGVKNYPAQHYLVAVWNHGAGWHRNFVEIPSVRDISFDDNTGNKITTEELGLAMADAKAAIGHNVDIYGSDACLMQMIEVAGEMKDNVDYFVGSQETEPAEGWPYETFLRKLAVTPHLTPKEVSILLSKEYLAAYSIDGVYGFKSSITFSAWDLSKLNGLYSAVTEFAKSLKNLGAADLSKVKTAAKATTVFLYSDYADLGDFSNQVRKMNIKTINTNLLSDIDSGVKDVVLTTDNDASFSRATGLSIWLPKGANSYQTRYNSLQFSKATQWNTVTEKIVK